MWYYFEFGPVVQEMPFEDISYLKLWQPFCSVEWNLLCKYARGPNEKHFSEIILNLDQPFRKCCLNIFLISYKYISYF